MRPRLRRGSWVYRTEVVTQGNDFVTKRGDSIGSLKNLHGILRRRPLFPRSLIRPTLRDRGSSSRRGRGRENRWTEDTIRHDFYIKSIFFFFKLGSRRGSPNIVKFIGVLPKFSTVIMFRGFRFTQKNITVSSKLRFPRGYRITQLQWYVRNLIVSRKDHVPVKEGDSMGVSCSRL